MYANVVKRALTRGCSSQSWCQDGTVDMAEDLVEASQRRSRCEDSGAPPTSQEAQIWDGLGVEQFDTALDEDLPPLNYESDNAVHKASH